jgi:hypothetical protein
MGTDLSVESHELIIVTNSAEAYEEGVNFDTLLIAEPFAEGMTRANEFRAADPSRSEFVQSLNDVDVLEFSQANTRMMFIPFTNSHGSLEFIRSHANVVDDEVYRNLMSGQFNALIAFELESGNHSDILDALLADLKLRNNLPDSAWQDGAEFNINYRDMIDGLRPLSRAERHDILLRANGFLLFAMAFLGLLFLASSCLVLYYKLAADTDEESENITAFKRIGLLNRECRGYLTKHIAIIFFLPLLLGGSLGLFLTYQFLSSSAYVGFLISRVAMMYGGIAVFGIVLYGALRRRFFKDVRV